jgi:hypothetical protein
MTIRIYNVETKETIHEFELSNRIKKEESIFKKVKDELRVKYGKEPRLIFSGKLDFSTRTCSEDSGYVNNLGIGKINYIKI